MRASTRGEGANTTRRRFLQGTAATLGAALVSPGDFYKMVDALAAPPRRPAHADRPPLQEQYLLQDTQVINIDGSGLKRQYGVAVHVPPLHDHVITARLNVSANAKALQEAQQHLESVLLGLEREFPPTPDRSRHHSRLGTSLLPPVHPKPGHDVGLL